MSTTRTVTTNGIQMQITEAGEGPLVVLCHGFPELSYSWRHQLPALADAGYHVVAPDQRGYGGTSRPEAVDEYDILHLSNDLVGVLDSLDVERAVFVGHDWGAPVVWHLAQRVPERVAGVVGMSVPFTPRAETSPMATFKQIFADTWFYILYFQELGVADGELGRDPATFIRRFLWTISGDAPDGAMAGMMSARDERGIVDRLPDTPGLPPWISSAEFEHFVAEFTRTGFTGGLNWYRNMERNWEITPSLAGKGVDVPAAFVAGSKDPVILLVPPDGMKEWVPDLRGLTMLEGAGHWIQQERPEEVNRALLGFLATLRLDA
jgi:pimeloyl-ACP methyl ester carboxylesterase